MLKLQSSLGAVFYKIIWDNPFLLTQNIGIAQNTEYFSTEFFPILSVFVSSKSLILDSLQPYAVLY